MPEMTREERVICALSLKEPDRVPLYDLVDNKAIIEHYANRTLTLENARDVIPLALSRVLDTTRIWMPQPPGRRVDERGFTHERRDWWNEWQVGKPFDDMPGLVALVQSEIERLPVWQPADPQEHLRERLDWKERFGGTVIPASWAGEALQDAYIALGLDWFVYLEAENADLVRRWLDALHAQTMRRLESEAGCQVVSPIAWVFADIAFKDHLMFSPEYLRQLGFFRRIAEMCDLYHSYGLKVIFHSDGDISSVVPDLIAAGVDALAPIDTPAGMNLADLKASFGHQVAFVGGIDLNVLSFGSVDDVRQTTLRALADAGPGGGFILGSSSEELYDALPEENIRTMFETTWECGRYPIGQYFP
jgi:uroporphyrinogen decarboxylase